MILKIIVEKVYEVAMNVNLGDLAYTIIIGLPFYLCGGADKIFTALLLFIVFDVISGILKAIKKGTLNSRTCREGITKKGLCFMVIAMGVQLDYVLGLENKELNTRFVVIAFYLGNEGISILENLSLMGVPIPTKITKILEQCQSGYIDNRINNPKNDKNKESDI